MPKTQTNASQVTLPLPPDAYGIYAFDWAVFAAATGYGLFAGETRHICYQCAVYGSR